MYLSLRRTDILIFSILQGLDLRPQHFHLFGNHGEGGHYHHDTEPTTVKYTAYLNVAKKLIRIDQPEIALLFGKD